MRSFILTAVLVFSSIFIFAQSTATMADSALEAGNYKLAKKLLLRDIKRDTMINSRFYTLSEIYSLLNMMDSSFFYLRKHVKKPYIPELVLNDPDLYNIRKDKRWPQMKTVLENCFVKNNPNLEKEPTLELIDLGAQDQAFVKEIEYFEKIFGKKSRQGDSLTNLKNNVYLKNQRRLVDILEKTGWPKLSEVGQVASNSAYQILLHSELDVQKKYLALFKNAVDNKEAKPVNYAAISDKIAIAENRKQSFGTQIRVNDKTKKNEVCPIEDEKNVDKRRKELGLEPLVDYLNDLGVKYKAPLK